MTEEAAAQAGTTARLLPFERLAKEIDRVLSDLAKGQVTTPERMALPLHGGGTALIMPATDDELLALKCVTVCPANRLRGLPSIQGEFLVKEARTGNTLLSLDAAEVTKRRTAALTLLAVRAACPGPMSSAMLIGAGAQARVHAEAFMEVLGVGRFVIVSRTVESAARLVRELETKGATASVATDARDAVMSVDIVLAATTSSTPVVPEDVPDRVFVAAIGAFKRGMAELPAALLERREVIVDTLDGARSEAGDLIEAVERRRWSWSRAVPLATFLTREAMPRSTPRLFKSVGHSAFDLAAARTAVAENAALPRD